MKNIVWIIAVTTVIIPFSATEIRAGRGGHFAGGGGGRAGGGAAKLGGGGRPNMGAHAPSMSRAAPSIHRPNVSRPNVSRPSASRPNISRPEINRPNVSLPRPGGNNGIASGLNRPNIGSGSRPNFGDGNRPNFGDGNRPNFGDGNRPNFGEGNRPNFGDGNRPNFGEGNRPNIGGANGPTFGDRRPSNGQLDDFLGIPGGGHRPTTLPGNINRPDLGNLKDRTDLADRVQGNNLGNKIGDRVSGNTIGNNIAGINNRDININAGNRVNIGRQTNINSMRNKWSNNVNRPFRNSNYWDAGFSRNPNAWRWQHGWNRYPANWGWRVGTWATVGTFFAWNWATPTPYMYNYGSTVVYRDNIVYVQDQQVATADQYYQQASTIAESIPTTADPDKEEWLPLGVFAISNEPATDTGLLIQLAVSKDGIIAGTFYNETTDSSRPIQGTVDPNSQRAAWKFADGKNEDLVMETVIHNLTEDQSTALVHFGPDRQENWTLVRMEAPQE